MAVGSYDDITLEIKSMKNAYAFLRNKPDDYAFAAMCVKANYYKNPSLNLTEDGLKEIVVDGRFDGGVDALLWDPNTETNDLVICQSKFYQSITFDEVRNAVVKMILFYKDMVAGHYENVTNNVSSRFTLLNAEVGEESKVYFVFYTSAPRYNIRRDRIEKLLSDYSLDPSIFKIALLFADDIVEEIKESKSRRPTVESGAITIDEPDNALYYGSDAVVVNVSAFSIKDLYNTNGTNLLALNLRYFIRKQDIDRSINDTIDQYPDYFWYRNNGITIICDDFKVDSKIVHLTNFSIVNGGQTANLLYKSRNISKEKDLYLPCKIIRVIGANPDEKNAFSLDIAKATNSQKAIKNIDLKSNAPEQLRFCSEMKEAGIYYQTKRGERIPQSYSIDYKHSDLAVVGKLCLSGIYQMPGSSRSKPSTLYNDRFYNPIFNGNQRQIVSLAKEMLYIDYFFWNIFIKRFDKENADSVNNVVTFAHNSRTICLAFVVFASRFYNGNISVENVKKLFDHCKDTKAYDAYFYDIFTALKDYNHIFPVKLFENKDCYDKALYELFSMIIRQGNKYYLTRKENDPTLNESNFLKIDCNYYSVLKFAWDEDFSKQIKKIFDDSKTVV